MAFIEPCFGIGHNLSLICQMTSEDIKHQLIIINFSRAQELCGSRVGRPGPLVPNSPYGLCGRKAALNSNIQFLLSRLFHAPPPPVPPPPPPPPLPQRPNPLQTQWLSTVNAQSAKRRLPQIVLVRRPPQIVLVRRPQIVLVRRLPQIVLVRRPSQIVLVRRPPQIVLVRRPQIVLVRRPPQIVLVRRPPQIVLQYVLTIVHVTRARHYILRGLGNNKVE